MLFRTEPSESTTEVGVPLVVYEKLIVEPMVAVCGPVSVHVGVTTEDEFDTVTETVLVALFPATSVAIALIECVPFDVDAVFHEMEYGAVVSSAPKFLPSIWNCTPDTPMLSDAVAVIACVPETVALFAGAVMETERGIVGQVIVGNVTPFHVAITPCAANIGLQPSAVDGSKSFEKLLVH